ncbi:MAG: DNA primase, partial [bacterium]
DGHDPDSLVREIGQEAFQELVSKAQPLSTFLFHKLSQQVDMDSLEGRARLATLGKPLIEKLPTGVYREMMTRELEQQVGNTHLDIAPPPPPEERKAQSQRQGELNPTHKAIALLLQYPELATQDGLPTGWEQPETAGKRILAALLDQLRRQPGTPAAALIERWDEPEVRKHLGRLAVHTFNIQDDAGAHFSNALKKLAQQQVEEERATLQNIPLADMSEEQKRRLRELYEASGNQ